MINIIGAGLAGCFAAVTLAEKDRPCRLISLQASERAQSNLAEGGINAALDLMGENDTAQEHFADTMRGGVDLADPEAVKGLTSGAPDIVRRLFAIGVPFSMNGDRMIQRNFGGQKKKRTAFAKSSTGKAAMTALIDQVRKYEGTKIHRYSHHRFLSLILSGETCTGVRVLDEYSGEEQCFDGPVILAAGGPNGLFPGMTTGTTANDADVLSVLFAQGVELANLEFIQYHPTTAAISGKSLLISEAARGEGGRLFVERDGGRWYFMEEKYPELGNLMPRDVVSREEYGVVRDPSCGDQVYLDLTGLPAEIWKKKLPDMRTEIRHYLGMDPASEPVPVRPGIHFFMGGVNVDVRHRTNYKGLYAAGECACQYHGANRLGGNSMLGAMYGGKTAAETATEEYGPAEEAGGNPAENTPEPYEGLSGKMAERIGGILSDALGIFRDEAGLEEGLQKIGLLKKEAKTAADLRHILLGEAFLRCALARKESRGAHQRTDYPKKDDERFKKTTVIRFENGEMKAGFREIGG